MNMRMESMGYTFAICALLVATVSPILLALYTRHNLRGLRKFPGAFWRFVDSNGVPPVWVIGYYLPLLIFSLGAAITLPIIGAHLVLSGIPMLLWFWVQAIATTTAMGGLFLRHSDVSVSDMNSWRLRREWFGLCLQATSHVVMSTMLAEFQIAAVKFLASGALSISSLVWWLLAYGAAAITPYTYGTFFLALQCFHKIDKGRKLQAEAP